MTKDQFHEAYRRVTGWSSVLSNIQWMVVKEMYYSMPLDDILLHEDAHATEDHDRFAQWMATEASEKLLDVRVKEIDQQISELQEAVRRLTLEAEAARELRVRLNITRQRMERTPK